MSESIRKVSTIFTIDDNEHNKKLKEINTQYKLTQSEIKLAGERLNQFGKNTDDLKYKQEALSKQTDTLKEKINLYKESIEKASNRAQENNKKLQELKTTKQNLQTEYKNSVKLYGEESDEAKKLKEQLEKVSEQYTEQKTVVEKNIATVNNHKTKLNETETQLSKVQQELKNTSDELEKQNSKWLEAGENLKKAGEGIENFGEKASKIGSTMTKTVTMPIVAIGTAAVKAQIDYESAFAGVRKTVDATEEQFEELSQGIRDMSTQMPQSAIEIAGVAEAAGQLGIKTENILGFTKSMVMLGDSTNMSSDEAATSLARLANITQMPQDEFEKLGSVIVNLGNNLATTESEIIEMGLRLAGAGKQIGLSEAEILGLAGAFSSVGIEAEMGGSAISKVMVKMQAATTIGSEQAQKLTEITGMSIRELELLASNNSQEFKELANSIGMTTTEINSIVKSANELEDFGKIAGMTGDEFKKAFEEDATTAIIAFIRGLGNAESAGSSAIEMLEEMGIKEVRLRDSLLRAANAGNLLEDSINMGTKAWEDNTALANEANQRYATTESQIKILKNEIMDMAREIGVELLPLVKDGMVIIKDLIEKFNNLSPATKENIIKFAGLSAVIGPVVGTAGKLAQGIGGVVKIAGTLSSALGVASTATSAVGTAAATAGGTAGIAGLATSLGGVAIAAAPYVAAGAAIAGAGYLVYKGLTEEVIPEVDLFADKIEYTANSMDVNGQYMTTSIETTVTKISESTKEAVGAYINLDDSARNEMQSLYINSTTISDEIKNSMTAKFNEMSTQIIAGYEKQKNDSMAQLQDMFNLQSQLTEQEQASILLNTSEFYEMQKTKTQEFESQINEIISLASQEKRALTKEETDQITLLQNQMRENAVKALSENEIEAQIILQRMKDYDTRMTAEQSAEHIRQLNESRDKAVAVANEEYEQRIASITRLRDEAGVISEEQAEKMIEDAKKQRDGVIREAENTRLDAIQKMREMNADLDDEVDTQTGKILNAWDKIKRWWTNWKPETKTFRVASEGSLINKRNIDSNALGTSYFKGGFTEINERGYEVIELPRGSKIKNHLQSENMIQNTAKETANNIMNGLGEVLKSCIENHGHSLYLDGKMLVGGTVKETDRRMSMNLSRAERGLA